MTSSFLRLKATGKNRGKVIPDTFFGMHLNSASPNGVFNQPQTPLHAELGFKAIRLWDTFTTWRRIAPLSPASPDLSRLDYIVNQAVSAGIDLLYTFGGPPDWATTPNVGTDATYNNYPPNNLSDWTNFITMIVTRYKGKIKYYEIWNEPQGAFNGTIDQLVSLATSGYATVKAADPSALVLTPPPAAAWIRDWEYLGNYLKAAQATGLPHADIVSVHAYVQPYQPEGIYAHGQCVKNIAKQFGMGSAPVWCSEFGYIGYRNQDTGVWVPTSGYGINMPPDQGAAYTSRMMLIAWLSGFERAYFYCMDARNIMNIAFINNPTDLITLLKPALAYKYLAGLLAGGTLSNYVNGAILHKADFTTAQNKSGVVCWCPDNKSTFVPSAGFSGAVDCVGSPVYPSNGQYSIGNSPIFLFN